MGVCCWDVWIELGEGATEGELVGVGDEGTYGIGNWRIVLGIGSVFFLVWGL